MKIKKPRIFNSKNFQFQRKQKKIDFRRRRENKTDYKARMALLKSKLPRIVIRKSNKYLMCQLVESKEAQDKIIFGINSREIAKEKKIFKQGNSFKNKEIAKELGKKFAEEAIKRKIKKVIIDMGMIKSTKGSRVYSIIYGAKKKGLEINVNKKMFLGEKNGSKNEQSKE